MTTPYIAICCDCKQEYYEPVREIRGKYCGHCRPVRLEACDYRNPRSVKLAEMAEAMERDIAIKTRPRVHDICKTGANK